MKKKPLVSIVVPVYNAEQVLGRCLNSIVSQTYRNLEIILINDGSTDDSLKICNNYADMDERIIVKSVDNGGVSKARNLGIEICNGEYIQFTDSDDVLDLEMIDLLLTAVYTYNSDIAFCGLSVSHYDEWDNLRVDEQFTSKILGRECILSKETFMKEFPNIILHTVMLEGPCNRIYNVNIIKNNKIFFPQDMSLGEDMIFNFKYYSLCNKIVFLENCLYYYVQHNEQALTKKFRKDMFQNKLAILNKYKEFIDLNGVWTDDGKEYFARYVVGYLTTILSNLFAIDSDMSEVEKKREIEQILNCKLIRDSVKNVAWIDEKWSWLKECFEFTDVGTVYQETKKIVEPIEESREILVIERNPGVINRLVRKMLYIGGRIFKSNRLREVEKTIYENGLKETIFKSKNKKEKKC